MYTSLSEEARNYILELIRRYLADGIKKLPTEREIASQLIASYATVRLVTRQLEAEGIIRKIRGSGTYISDDAPRIIAGLQRKRLFFFHTYMLHEPELDFGVWFIREIEKEAKKKNWDIRSIAVGSHNEFIRKSRALTKAGDAILYLPPGEEFLPEHIGELSHFSDRPLIVLDRELGDLSISNISTDNRRGGMIAARRFLELGIRDVAIFISEPPSRQLQSRIQGFCEIAELVNIRPAWIDCHILTDDDRITLSSRALDEFLKDNPAPAGIFAVSDTGALGLLASLEAHQIKVGDEVKIIGFDGLAFGKQQNISLATVVQPVTEMVQAVFYTLEHWNSMPHTIQQFAPYFREGNTLGKNSLKKNHTNDFLPRYMKFLQKGSENSFSSPPLQTSE